MDFKHFPFNHFRKVSDTKGGLCGLAALYQALENTILTTSALGEMSYDAMRGRVAEELGLESQDSKSLSDEELLEWFYEG